MLIGLAIGIVGVTLPACSNSNPSAPDADLLVNEIQIDSVDVYVADIPLKGEYPPGQYLLRVNEVEKAFTTE